MKRKDLEQVFDDMSSSKSRRLDTNSIGDMAGVPSSAFQVFDNQRFLKRKELEGGFDDMSYKSRRLDGDLFPTMAGERGRGVETLEPMLAQEPLLSSQGEMQQGGLEVEQLPLCDENDKALVLYNPSTTFYKTPASSDFSIIVNSDLIPGLRDHLSNPHSMWAKQLQHNQSNRDDSNGCMAIVPWVESNWPSSATSAVQATQFSEPMQAEEVEMMDTDDSIPDGFKPSYDSGSMIDGSSEYQLWQQQQLHCMQPQGAVALDNTCLPITWW